jgi:hypothetical protein
MLVSLWAAFPEGFQTLIKSVLAKHGVGDVVPENWYRLQSVLDALKEMEEKYGHQLMTQVGEQAALRAPVPPEIDTLKKCLLAMNITLKKIHRNGDAGGYDIQEKTEDGLRRYVVTASTPYPCSLTRGYLEGYSRRFGHTEAKEVLVRHDDTGPCRRQGAQTCTYIITLW